LITQKITALVNSSTPPTNEELTQMMGQSGSTVITPQIINILKNSPLDKVLIKQLSDDIAIANTIRYALEARRILLAGRNENHIASYEVAIVDIDQRALRLKENIEELMFERKIRREFLSDTLAKIYSNTQHRQSDGVNTTPSRIRPIVRDGAIQLN